MTNDHKRSDVVVNTFCFVLYTPSHVLWRKSDKQILGTQALSELLAPFVSFSIIKGMFCFALNSSKLWWDNPPWDVTTVDFFVAVPAQSTCFQPAKKYNFEISRRVVPKPLSCLRLCTRMRVQYSFVLSETINFLNWNFELNWTWHTLFTDACTVYIIPEHQNVIHILLLGSFTDTLHVNVIKRQSNSPVPVNSPPKGQWCGALMFSLICAWIYGWVNNFDAGDLRRKRAHYDVNIMERSFGCVRCGMAWCHWVMQCPVGE